MTTSLREYATNFVPSDNLPLNLGKHTMYVYPSLHGEMSLSEKSYMFMVNKSALKSANIPIKAHLQAICASHW
jgi:cytochrome c